MLLFCVLVVLAFCWDWTPSAPPVVGLWLLVGAGLALGVVGWRFRNRPGRWLAALLVLEELFVAGLGALELIYPRSTPLFAGACALTVVLISGLPLPDGLLPLRGVWLRRLLAGVALAGLAQHGPWIWLVDSWRTYGLPAFPLVAALVTAGWLLLQTAETLAARPPKLRIRARARPVEG